MDYQLNSNTIKTLRVIFGVLFLALSAIVAIYLVYFVWFALYGLGWVGGDVELLELIWKVKAPILICLFSLVAAFGLFFKKRWGSLIGLGLCISAMFGCCEFIITGIDSGNIDTTLSLFASSLHLFMVFFLMVGVLKLVHNSYVKFKIKQYLTLGLVISSVLLSYYTLFS